MRLPQGTQWPQGVPLPDVMPRRPGTRSPDALPEDAPQPTSVLGHTELTQSIVPPKPVVDPPPPVESSRPGTAPGTGPHTGSGPFPGTGRRTGSRTTGRGRLGAGLVDVPLVPVRDPASAVLPDAVVAEAKRYCNNCGAKVGRAANGQPGSPVGSCPTCGTPFNFRPRLTRGELVGGQYEVLGCLAYGGLGWIYLAKDHNVSDRWVVLKGLIDTGDATSMASAVAERQYLAEVEHPNIVKIYNFVQHPDRSTGTAVGYIVMEYVGGQSLRELALEYHRAVGRAEPLPIGQVIAYGLEILPAIGYLHSVDLLYCDLKPDNVIQSGEQLKLIDLGAVRRAPTTTRARCSSRSATARRSSRPRAPRSRRTSTPSAARWPCCPSSSTATPRATSTPCPAPDEVPLFALFGSYYRILKRATHERPAQAVLLGRGDGRAAHRRPAGDHGAGHRTGRGRARPRCSAWNRGPSAPPSRSRRPPNWSRPCRWRWQARCRCRRWTRTTPAAGVLASITGAEPAELLELLAGAPPDSLEVRLRMVRAHIELGDVNLASADLAGARRLAVDPEDWRLDWYQGLIALAKGHAQEALTLFDRVYDALPGEIAPKLALGVSAEYAGDHFSAARFYELVWRTDHAYVSAAFGLARVYVAQGAKTSAIEVLESVPDSSSHHVAAQVAAIKIKTKEHERVKVGEDDLHDAARKLERLSLDAERSTRLSVTVLEAAHQWVRAGRHGAAPLDQGRTLLGCALDERELRLGLERCYRALARLAGTAEQRHELVDKANAIRPRTLT